MKYEDLLTQAMLAILIPGVAAYPGGKMAKTLEDIRLKVKARGLAPINSVEDSDEMIGDLVTPGPTSTVGKVRRPYSVASPSGL